MLQGFENKSAQAVCTFAYCDASCHEDPVLFQGVQKGSIVEPRGILDSGWDPIFVPENETQT